MTETDASLQRGLDATAGGTIWIRVGTLFDGSEGAPLRNAHVVYDAEGIRFVGADGRPPPRAIVPAEEAEPSLDLPGHTLLPLLVDAHAHLFLDGSDLDLNRRKAHLEQTPEALLMQAEARLPTVVASGVGAVRDAGDRHGVGLALSAAYRDRRLTTAPYIDSPGSAIHREGRYGSFMAEPVEAHADPAACVESRLSRGARRIKIIATGIIDFREGRVKGAPQFSVEALTKMVRAAHAHGCQTFAHASGADGIERVIEAGVDTVEHGYFIREDQLSRMRDRDLAWVPTFAPVQAQLDHADRFGWDDSVADRLQRILDGQAASLRKASKLGVRIIAGSDAGSPGVPHGTGLIDELVCMEAAGLSTQYVLIAATGAAVDRLDFAEPVAQTMTGHRARFILTPHAPLEAVSNLKKSRLIVFDGAVIESRDAAPGD